MHTRIHKFRSLIYIFTIQTRVAALVQTTIETEDVEKRFDTRASIAKLAKTIRYREMDLPQAINQDTMKTM